jgi:hypothetical protein
MSPARIKAIDELRERAEMARTAENERNAMLLEERAAKYADQHSSPAAALRHMAAVIRASLKEGADAAK